MEIIKLLGIFLILNAIFYLLGSFITLDLNCSNWSMLSCAPGRLCFIILEIFIFGMAVKIDE